MSAVGRPAARRGKPAAPMPAPVQEDDYDYDDYDGQQYYAPPPPPPPSQPSLYPSPATRSSPRRARTQQYREEEVEQEEETTEEVEPAQQPRATSSSLPFSSAPQPRRLSQQQRGVSSSYSSSSHSVLSPTSVAAFDPLVSPDSRSAAARALTKRASLRMPADVSTAASSSYDYFDAVDPSPPAYEQVLASDDVIAAQFSSQLSMTAPLPTDSRRFDVGQKAGTPKGSTPKGGRPAPPPPPPPPSAAAAAAASARLRASPHRAAPAGRRASVEEEQEEEEEVAEAVVLPRPVMRKATSQPARRRQAQDAAVLEQQQDEYDRQLQRQRRVQRATAVEERQEDEEELEQEAVVMPRRAAAAAGPRQRVQSSQSVPSMRAGPERQQAAVRGGGRRAEVKQREEELEEQYRQEEEEEPPARTARRPSAQRAAQQRPQRALSREVEDKRDDDEDAEEDEQAPHRPQQRSAKAAAARPSASLHSSASSPTAASSRLFRPSRVKVDALAFMRAGTPFLKYSSSLFSSPPHFRLFQLLTSPVASIVWFSSAKALSATSIPLSAISAVLLGQQTATFAKHKAVELAALSFSIVYADAAGKEKTLDLTAKDGNEMNIWIAGIDRMRRMGQQQLEGKKVVLVDITVMYGGSPSQDIAEYRSGRVVDTRKRSQIEEEERQRRSRTAAAAGGEQQGLGSASAVHSSLYRELQPRFQRLQSQLLKRKEEAKRADVLNSALHESVQAMLGRVDAKCGLVSNALMDGQLELADQQLWLASVELDGVDNVLASIK